MGSVVPDKWTAEVPIDEPLRSSMPMWSIGRITGSVTDLDLEPGSNLLGEMATWLQQRSVGAWRFVERERVSGRASLLYRCFQFEQEADGRLFAETWAEALIGLRLNSLQGQFAELGHSATFEIEVEGEAPGRKKRAIRDRLDDAIAHVVDVWPLRRRARTLEKLRRRLTHRKLRELVTIDHGGDG